MNNKQLIVYYLRRLYEKSLTTCFGGNISIRESEHFIISETGIDKCIINENNISYVAYDNTIINNVKPSSEYMMHSMIYNNNKNVNAIIHAHPPYATSYALSNVKLDTTISSEMYKNLGKISICEYEKPGSLDLAIAVNEAAKESNTILMKNHGVIVLARDIHKAYYMIELLEQLAKMSFIISAIGDKSPINLSKLNELGGF